MSVEALDVASLKKQKQSDVVVEQVRLLVRSLKVPGLGKRLDELVRQVDAESTACIDILDDALSTEVSSREASSVRLRIREARFPDVLTLTFDFAHGVDPKQVVQLARGGFVDEKQTACSSALSARADASGHGRGVEMARRRQR